MRVLRFFIKWVLFFPVWFVAFLLACALSPKRVAPMLLNLFILL